MDDSSLTGEHEARNINTTNPSGYTPSPEEQKTLKLVDSLYKRAKKHRSKYDGNWLEYYKFFRGKQWKEQRPSYRHSEVINLVFQSIQSTVPIQTDSRPKLTFVPVDPTDTEFSEIINKVCESDWERGNWLEVLTEIVYEQNFYGRGFGSVEVDPDSDTGQPEIKFKSKDPFYQFPDPAAIDCNDRCKYWIEAEPVDVEVLKKDYPDKAQYIKSDVIDLNGEDKTNIEKTRFKSPVDNRTLLDAGSGFDTTDRNQALKLTCYIKPGEYESQDDQDADPISTASTQMAAPLEGGPATYSDVPTPNFANGRKIVVASGLVLYNGENPYDDKKIPYAGLTNYLLPREFWGISEVEQLMGPNKIYNKVLSFTLDVMTLMGNPIWVVDTTAGIDTDNLFNRPGLVLEKEPQSEVRRESGVELQPYILPLLDRVAKMFDNLSGAKDVTKPAGDGDDLPSGDAIDSIQEAAQTRLRLKSRHMDAFLQQMGQLYIERVMQFYNAPRIVRITGDGDGFKYFKFHIETKLDLDGNEITDPTGKPQKVAIVRNYVQNLDTGKISENLDAQSFEIHGQFDVRTSTGSSLPFAKSEKANKAIQLYTLAPPPGGGVIDAEELLNALDYPNAEAVLQRMKEERAQAAAAAAAQPQPPPK